MSTLSEALYALGIDGGWKIKEGQIVKWWADKPQPSEEEIQTKLQELRVAEPMRVLREERNQRLSETDWRDLPSYPGTDQNEWRTYRQALRNITETQTPTLDENGQLTNVTWPTKPT